MRLLYAINIIIFFINVMFFFLFSLHCIGVPRISLKQSLFYFRVIAVDFFWISSFFFFSVHVCCFVGIIFVWKFLFTYCKCVYNRKTLILNSDISVNKKKITKIKISKIICNFSPTGCISVWLSMEEQYTHIHIRNSFSKYFFFSNKLLCAWWKTCAHQFTAQDVYSTLLHWEDEYAKKKQQQKSLIKCRMCYVHF